MGQVLESKPRETPIGVFRSPLSLLFPPLSPFPHPKLDPSLDPPPLLLPTALLSTAPRPRLASFVRPVSPSYRWSPKKPRTYTRRSSSTSATYLRERTCIAYVSAPSPLDQSLTFSTSSGRIVLFGGESTRHTLRADHWHVCVVRSLVPFPLFALRSCFARSYLVFASEEDGNLAFASCHARPSPWSTDVTPHLCYLSVRPTSINLFFRSRRLLLLRCCSQVGSSIEDANSVTELVFPPMKPLPVVPPPTKDPRRRPSNTPSSTSVLPHSIPHLTPTFVNTLSFASQTADQPAVATPAPLNIVKLSLPTPEATPAPDGPLPPQPSSPALAAFGELPADLEEWIDFLDMNQTALAETDDSASRTVGAGAAGAEISGGSSKVDRADEPTLHDAQEKRCTPERVVEAAGGSGKTLHVSLGASPPEAEHQASQAHERRSPSLEEGGVRRYSSRHNRRSRSPSARRPSPARRPHSPSPARHHRPSYPRHRSRSPSPRRRTRSPSPRRRSRSPSSRRRTRSPSPRRRHRSPSPRRRARSPSPLRRNRPDSPQRDRRRSHGSGRRYSTSSSSYHTTSSYHHSSSGHPRSHPLPAPPTPSSAPQLPLGPAFNVQVKYDQDAVAWFTATDDAFRSSTGSHFTGNRGDRKLWRMGSGTSVLDMLQKLLTVAEWSQLCVIPFSPSLQLLTIDLAVVSSPSRSTSDPPPGTSPSSTSPSSLRVREPSKISTVAGTTCSNNSMRRCSSRLEVT